jgi:hypothetical protein
MTTMRRIRRTIGATMGLAAVLICTSAQANGAGPRNSPRHRADTFSGQCQFTGTVTFQPPLSNTPQNITQHVDAPGTCSGTFAAPGGGSRQLDHAQATYVATERSSGASCAGGTASGTGALVLPYGDIEFSESETRAGVVVVATATGAAGGSAAGYAAPTPDQNPVTAAQECAGSGIPSATVNIQLTTTPSISG